MMDTTIIKEEIRVREIVLKKLRTSIEALDKVSARKKAKQKQEMEKLLEYKTYEEAHEAYGWGFISDAEFEQIQNILEGNNRELEKPCVEETAAKIMREWAGEMASDIHALQFELLPTQEQVRILEANLEKTRKKEREWAS